MIKLRFQLLNTGSDSNHLRRSIWESTYLHHAWRHTGPQSELEEEKKEKKEGRGKEKEEKRREKRKKKLLRPLGTHGGGYTPCLDTCYEPGNVAGEYDGQTVECREISDKQFKYSYRVRPSVKEIHRA